jgi:hypothetical protein
MERRSWALMASAQERIDDEERHSFWDREGGNMNNERAPKRVCLTLDKSGEEEEEAAPSTMCSYFPSNKMINGWETHSPITQAVTAEQSFHDSATSHSLSNYGQFFGASHGDAAAEYSLPFYRPSRACCSANLCRLGFLI